MNVHRPVVSTETLLDIVSDRQRRRVVRHLVDDEEGILEMEELAEMVADGSESLEGADEEALERVTARLYHVHLPRLAASDLVEFDSRSETVRYHSHDDMEELLRFIETEME